MRNTVLSPDNGHAKEARSDCYAGADDSAQCMLALIVRVSCQVHKHNISVTDPPEILRKKQFQSNILKFGFELSGIIASDE